MNNKHFLASKINWAAIILILTSFQPLLEETDFTGLGVKGWTTFVIGVVILILRTYYTSTEIKKPL